MRTDDNYMFIVKHKDVQILRLPLKRLITIILSTIMYVIIPLASYAEYTYEDDMKSVEQKQEVKYTNIKSIESSFDNRELKNFFILNDINKNIGECVYEISNATHVSVTFYHLLSTVAHKANNTYVLGISSYIDSSTQKIVSYLPSDDSLYLRTKSPNWYKCFYDPYNNKPYIFERINDDEKVNLDTKKDELIDYGVNIYTSSDGENFKRITNPDLKIEFISDTLSQNDQYANVDAINDVYLETLTAEIPTNTNYIKISINETCSFASIDENENRIEPDPATYVSSIKFHLTESAIIQDVITIADSTQGNVNYTNTKHFKKKPKKRHIQQLVLGASKDIKEDEPTEENIQNIQKINKIKRRASKPKTVIIKKVVEDPESMNHFIDDDLKSIKYQKNKNKKYPSSLNSEIENDEVDDSYDFDDPEQEDYDKIDISKKVKTKGIKKSSHQLKTLKKNKYDDKIVSKPEHIEQSNEYVYNKPNIIDNSFTDNQVFTNERELIAEKKQEKKEKVLSITYLSTLALAGVGTLVYDKISSLLTTSYFFFNKKKK